MNFIETSPAFYRRVASIAIPITLQSLITIGVNLIDTIMLGAVGETALSAASQGNQFILFFNICCMGVGMGAAVLTSRFFGASEMRSLKMSITIALRIAILLALIFTLINAFATWQVISLYTKENDVREAGVAFLKWSTPGFFLSGISLVCTQIMRSVNLVRVPLIASFSAFFINIGANYIFIFGKLGMPAMGVRGAALGTVLARCVEFTVITVSFFIMDKRIKYRIKDIFNKCSDMLREYMRISTPVLVSDALLGLGLNVVAMVMGQIGSTFVSANAITSVAQQLSTVFIQGVSFASSIITGQTLGEGRIQDAKRQGYTFLCLGIIIGIVAGAIIFLIRTPVINAYKVTDDTKQIAEKLMDAISIIVVFQAANSILTKGVLRGGGDTKFLMVADILFLWVMSIPLGALAALVWGVPVFWVYICLKIDQFLKAIWCVFRLKSGKWIKKVHSAEK